MTLQAPGGSMVRQAYITIWAPEYLPAFLTLSERVKASSVEKEHSLLLFLQSLSYRCHKLLGEKTLGRVFCLAV